MRFFQVISVVALSVLVAFATASFTKSERSTPAKETAYERVMRTNTLRCGYFQYPRFLERNLNSGTFSGLYYDLLEEIGKELSLKIEWTEEVGLASIFDGLKAERYDAICMPMNQTPARARVTEFTIPVFYIPYFLYARTDDVRFDNAYDKINDPSVKIAVLEGEQSQKFKEILFPKAQTVSLPDISTVSEVLLQVTTGKADITLTIPSSAEIFMTNNPGKMRRVSGPSLSMQIDGLSVAIGEVALKNLLDTTLRYLHANGSITRLVDKYTSSPDQFFYAAQSWGIGSNPLKN